MSQTGENLSGSYSINSGSYIDSGFIYGTSPGNLTRPSSTGILTGLTPGTKYYYRYYVTVQGTGEYSSKVETFYSDEASFTTASISTWLTNYEIPATDASEVTESNTQYAGRYCHYAVSAETKLGPMTLQSTRADRTCSGICSGDACAGPVAFHKWMGNIHLHVLVCYLVERRFRHFFDLLCPSIVLSL